MKAFFQALGRLALVFKLVVTKDGDVIARNYSIKGKNGLKPGDIGVHCRVDLGSTEGEYTPAQELALAQIAPRVADAFLSSCGVEPAGFSPGDIVKLDDDTNCLVLQDKGTIMRVQKINAQGKLVRCTLHSQNVEEVPVERKGLVGLLLADLRYKYEALHESFIELSMDHGLLNEVIRRSSGTMVKKLRHVALEAILELDDPLEHIDSLEVIALSEDSEAKEMLFTWVLSQSTEERHCDLILKLASSVRGCDEFKSLVEKISSDEQELLIRIATEVASQRSLEMLILVIEEIDGSYPGRLDQVLNRIAEANRFNDAPYLANMLVEEGVEVSVVNPGGTWMSVGDDTRLVISHEGGEESWSIQRSLGSSLIDSSAPRWLKLRGKIKVDDSFWEHLERYVPSKKDKVLTD